jgi:acetyl esterase/lipase
MLTVALALAGLLLLWAGMLWVTLPGFLPYLPRVYAAAYSLEIALIGLAGAVVGSIAGSVPVALAYGVVAAAAGIPVLRLWLTPDVLTGAFGTLTTPEGRDRYMLRRAWGLRLAPVPEPRVQRDIPFWTPPGSTRPLLCDLWQPPTDVQPSGLAFIYFHGSTWVLFDKDAGTRPLFRHLAAQGHAVMDVAYRLYPDTDIEGMVGDVRRSVAWLKANTAAYGINPDRIVVGGGSAGGHIAMLAAYTEGRPELTPPDTRGLDTSVRGVLAWYAPVDLAACYFHYHNDVLARTRPDQPDWNAPLSPMMRRLMGRDAERLHLQKAGGVGRLDWMLGGSPEQVPARYALLSPITHAHAGCPPTLLMQGPRDIIVPIASTREMHRRLRQAGVPAALLVLPQVDHAFDLFGVNWSPSARLSLWHAERFLALVASHPLGREVSHARAHDLRAQQSEVVLSRHPG